MHQSTPNATVPLPPKKEIVAQWKAPIANRIMLTVRKAGEHPSVPNHGGKGNRGASNHNAKNHRQRNKNAGNSRTISSGCQNPVERQRSPMEVQNPKANHCDVDQRHCESSISQSSSQLHTGASRNYEMINEYNYKNDERYSSHSSSEQQSRPVDKMDRRHDDMRDSERNPCKSSDDRHFESSRELDQRGSRYPNDDRNVRPNSQPGNEEFGYSRHSYENNLREPRQNQFQNQRVDERRDWDDSRYERYPCKPFDQLNFERSREYDHQSSQRYPIDDRNMIRSDSQPVNDSFAQSRHNYINKPHEPPQNHQQFGGSRDLYERRNEGCEGKSPIQHLSEPRREHNPHISRQVYDDDRSHERMPQQNLKSINAHLDIQKRFSSEVCTEPVSNRGNRYSSDQTHLGQDVQQNGRANSHLHDKSKLDSNEDKHRDEHKKTNSGERRLDEKNAKSNIKTPAVDEAKPRPKRNTYVEPAVKMSRKEHGAWIREQMRILQSQNNYDEPASNEDTKINDQAKNVLDITTTSSDKMKKDEPVKQSKESQPSIPNPKAQGNCPSKSSPENVTSVDKNLPSVSKVVTKQEVIKEKLPPVQTEVEKPRIDDVASMSEENQLLKNENSRLSKALNIKNDALEFAKKELLIARNSSNKKQDRVNELEEKCEEAQITIAQKDKQLNSARESVNFLENHVDTITESHGKLHDELTEANQLIEKQKQMLIESAERMAEVQSTLARVLEQNERLSLTANGNNPQEGAEVIVPVTSVTPDLNSEAENITSEEFQRRQESSEETGDC